MPKFPSAPGELRLRYAQLEELIAGLLDVHEDRIPALTARLRLFRQRGFPPNLAMEGSRFTYDLDAVIRTALAFAMLNAALPQEGVPGLIEGAWTEVRHAFSQCFAKTAKEGPDAVLQNPERPVLAIVPQGLALFGAAKGREEEGDEPERPAEARLTILPASRLEAERSRVARGNPMEVVATLDLAALAIWLRGALLAARWTEPEAIR